MAVRFSASGQRYTSTSGVPTTRLFSVVLWFKAATIQGAGYDIIWALDSGAGGDYNTLYLSAGTLSVDWPGGGATGISGASVSTGNWVKTALTVNGNDAFLYQGSATSGLTSYTTGANYALPSGTATLYLGDSAAGAYPLNGCIAAFKMWDAVLSAAELDRELRYYIPQRCANLNRWHPFVRAETTDYGGAGRTLSGGSGTTTEAGPPIAWSGPRGVTIPWDPTATVWYAVYDNTSGELVSVGTILANPLPSGLAYKEFVGSQPNLSIYEWDTVARTFVLRSGYDLVDRVADLVADASLASVWATLDATQKTTLQNRIGTLLGSKRYRLSTEPVDLD